MIYKAPTSIKNQGTSIKTIKKNIPVKAVQAVPGIYNGKERVKYLFVVVQYASGLSCSMHLFKFWKCLAEIIAEFPINLELEDVTVSTWNLNLQHKKLIMQTNLQNLSCFCGVLCTSL